MVTVCGHLSVEELEARYVGCPDATASPLKVKLSWKCRVHCAIELMRPIGLVEVSRTGVAAMSRGPDPA
jgi:acetolactate synthase small subunit